MRASRTLPIALLALATFAPVTPAVADQATRTVVVTAQFSSRTSLTLSARVLDFEVADVSEAATVAVEFSAGARTAAGSEVLLSVEPERATSGPGGAADVETALSFTGDGEGTLAGALAPHAPAVAGRWTGSGLRTGRLTFELRAAAPGRYAVPVRFVLSAP